eukprot:1448496-Prymnesium_polylepis.2
MPTTPSVPRSPRKVSHALSTMSGDDCSLSPCNSAMVRIASRAVGPVSNTPSARPCVARCTMSLVRMAPSTASFVASSYISSVAARPRSSSSLCTVVASSRVPGNCCIPTRPWKLGLPTTSERLPGVARLECRSRLSSSSTVAIEGATMRAFGVQQCRERERVQIEIRQEHQAWLVNQFGSNRFDQQLITELEGRGRPGCGSGSRWRMWRLNSKGCQVTRKLLLVEPRPIGSTAVAWTRLA